MSTPFKAESRHWMLMIALLISFYACYRLVEPYVGAIILAFVLSLLWVPVHRRIERSLKSPTLAALVSSFLLVAVIVIPASLVFLALVQQGIVFTRQSYAWLSGGGAQQLLQDPYVQQLLAALNEWLPYSEINDQVIIQRITESASSLGKILLDLSTMLLSNVTGLLFSFVLMLFVLFFLLRDHEQIVRTLYAVVPLSRSQKEILLTELGHIARSAVLGSVLTAMVQGAAGGIAMALAGFPGLFWGTMMAFASFIPVVGTALIWMPACLYLLLSGDWQWALFLGLWGSLIVGSIDNFLRPVLMQGNSNMSTLLLFLSLIGGLQLFGLIGLLYGPIIFGLTLVLFKLYTAEFKSLLEKQDKG